MPKIAKKSLFGQKDAFFILFPIDALKIHLHVVEVTNVTMYQKQVAISSV
jgi:hypothetical protein